MRDTTAKSNCGRPIDMRQQGGPRVILGDDELVKCLSLEAGLKRNSSRQLLKQRRHGHRESLGVEVVITEGNEEGRSRSSQRTHRLAPAYPRCHAASPSNLRS